MDKKKLIDKVVKLLALSENNSETAEAKSAKEMAAKLMAKHDISYIETREKPDFKTFNKVLTRLYPIKYDSTLINVISSFNGVGYFIRRGLNRGPNKCPGANIFCGREANIQANDYMLEIVFQQRQSAWKRYLEEYKEKWSLSPKEKDKKEWMFGFMFGVQDKLKSLTKMKDQKVQEYGLVPVDESKQAIDFYTADNDVRKTKSRSIGYNSDGREAGKNVSINKGIKTQKINSLLA